MKAQLNQVFLMGRLTRDCEVRYTDRGTPWTNNSLAINRSYPGPDGGDWKEEATFVEVSFWDQSAAKAGNFRKGQSVLIQGHLHLDVWDDKNSGQKRTKLKVIGETIESVQ